MILAHLIDHFEETGCENVSVSQFRASIPPSKAHAVDMNLFILGSQHLHPCRPRKAQCVTSQLLLRQQVVDLGLQLCLREEWNQGGSKVPVETVHKSWRYL